MEEPLATPKLSDCLAKLRVTEDDKISKGVDVATHCIIVGLVAREIIAILPESVRLRLFPDGSELVAAVHDIGKINPHFQEKLHRLLPGYGVNTAPWLKNGRPESEKAIGMHSGVSQIALKGAGQFVQEIVGMHHGSSPGTLPFFPNDTILGGKNWQDIREELIELLKNYFKQDWPTISTNTQALAIAGLTTVSDWIGSGPVFAGLQTLENCNYIDRVQKAARYAGFISPQIVRGLDFETVFPSFKPKPIQKTFYESVSGPGVYILESLMGSGKTEAALFAAYRMLEKKQANGIYFALPTRITSDKIHERMSLFLQSILSPEDRHKVMLAHGTAWMTDTNMGEDAQPGYSWFDSRKRKLLSPFAVGTIDQALMAVMNVRHGFVRTFGLAGKVIILDEVHTYDAYTGTVLDYLIQALRELGSTVILLSATLTSERKKIFLGNKNYPDPEMSESNYPLISAAVEGYQIRYATSGVDPQQVVHLSMTDNEESIIDTVRSKSLNGEYILWIENSVNEAQKTFKSFAAWGGEKGVDVGLLHSRFPAVTRQKVENYWVRAYGKEGLSERGKEGRILVGTQILEQSLDLDADLLVSRIAPTDMVLQRIGRLWRHRAPRPNGAERRVYILSPSIENVLKNPEWAFGSSGVVYSPYILYRSLSVLEDKKSIAVPTDMRTLIENTYIEQKEEVPQINAVKHQIHKRKETLRNLAMNTMTMLGKAESDMISTRYSEVKTCDVLLLKEEANLQTGELVFIDGMKMNLPEKEALNLAERKRLSMVCMQRTLSIPEHLAPYPVSMKELSILKPFIYISELEEERLRVAVLQNNGRITGLNGRIAHERYELGYHQTLGYTAKKKEDRKG